MTLITDLYLPDDVARALRKAWLESGDRSVLEADKFAIRAALQAMCDCGMAAQTTVFRWHFEGERQSPQIPVLAIRLDKEPSHE